MIACFTLLGIGAVLLCLFLIDKCHKYSVRATAIKGLTSVCFIAVAVCGWYMTIKSGNFKIMGIFVVLGLLFGLLGDISLDLKYVFKQEDKIFTKFGFLTFGIGHLLYMIGMLLDYYKDENILYLILPFISAGLFTLGVILLEKPMKVKYGTMKPIALTYGYILALMMSMAFSLSLMHDFKYLELNLILAGGILFIISDLILCGTFFAENRERPVDIITNTVTYYMAQFLIAFSLLAMIL